MSFTVRHLKEEDYEILSNWWTFWWKKPVNRKILPDNISDGVMIEYKGTPVSAGFLYSTSSSSLFWMEFIITSNTFRDKILRQEAIDFNIKILIEIAKRAGAISIYSSIKNQNLINKYLDNGFTFGDKGMTSMVYNFV